MPDTEQTAQYLQLAENVRIAYQRSAGRTPGVMFLGGYSSNMTGSKALELERWCRQQQRAFVRFDYQGHGASSGRFEDGTIGCWAADALAVFDRLTTGPQILVGSSMGGWMMLLTALARPERVSSLVGIAAAPDFTEELIWNWLDEASKVQLQREGVVYVPSEYDEKPYPVTLKFIEDGRQHRLLHQPIALDCPVRLLHGMNDRDVPWQTSTRLAEQLSGDNVRVMLIKDGEHRLSRPQDLALLTATVAELSEDG